MAETIGVAGLLARPAGAAALEASALGLAGLRVAGMLARPVGAARMLTSSASQSRRALIAADQRRVQLLAEVRRLVVPPDM